MCRTAASPAVLHGLAVRTALSRFDQVQDVTDADRALAFENIRRAAAHFGVDMTEQSWHDLIH